MGLISYSDYNDEHVLYERNAHGDVVMAIKNSNDNYGFGRSYEYDAFGIEKYPWYQDPNPMRYCSQYYDTETGDYYLRARYYTPSVGRFLQEDTHWSISNMIYGDKKADKHNGTSNCFFGDCEENPILFKNIKNNLEYYNYFIPKSNLKEQKVDFPDYSAISQSCNLYTYCLNNPIKYSDSSGESFTLAAIGICIAISGVTLLLTGCTNIGGEYVPDFPGWDPTVSPGNSWEWRGSGPVGSQYGSWYNPYTNESLHPDLNHSTGIAPHWDFKSSNGNNYRIFEDGSYQKK